MPTRSEKEIKIRDEQAPEYEKWYLQRGKINVLLEDTAIEKALDLQPEDVILDMGCGTGRFISDIAAKAKKIYGLDISPKSIDILNAKHIKNIDGIVFDWVLDDIKSLNIEPVDKILSVQTIQHIEKQNWDGCLQKIKNILKQNGKVVFELYNWDGYQRKKERKVNNTITKTQYSDDFFEYRFSPKEFKALLERNGFCDVKTYGISCFNRKFVNKFSGAKKFLWFDKILQKMFFANRLGYYFIAVAQKKDN